MIKRTEEIKVLIFVLGVFVVFSISAYAQKKLPGIQKEKVIAPADIKIDGRLDEWGDKLVAYNQANGMSYTIANNEKYLYLAVKMDAVYGRKILRGGLVFSISPEKGNNLPLSITYPIGKTIKRDGDPAIEALVSGPSREWFSQVFGDTVANRDKINERVSSSSQMIRQIYTEIQVTGIPSIQDSILSIYNPEGIRTAGIYNQKMQYVYELAIPLKLIPSIGGNNKIKYNIKLKAFPTPDGGPGKGRSMGTRTDLMSADDVFFLFTTDFSGEYTLAE